MSDKVPITLSPSFDLPSAIQSVLQIIDKNLLVFASQYPDNTTINNVYYLRQGNGVFSNGGNFGWTTGFWPGMLWLAYELTNDYKYREVAEKHIENFIEQIDNKIDVDTHDLGFLYTLSCVAPWRLTGNQGAEKAALAAAEGLMTRFWETAGIVQAWGDLNNPEQRGRTIIDSLMNMPLLYWASRLTNESRFADAAKRHTQQLRDHIIRPDNTTYHTFYWDPETGEPLRGNTAQGYADHSCWARGQAWGIYGFVLNYRYTSDNTFLVAAQRCADYFLDHLPNDQVAYWDLVFTDGDDQPRDSSAAAIAVCGLQEMIRWLPKGEQYQRYLVAANQILSSLSKNYSTCNYPESNALLLHGVYNQPNGVGVDEGNLWGDYFYMEALIRSIKPDWKPYW